MRCTAIFGALACLGHFALCSVFLFKKESPSDAEQEAAKEYMDEWKKTGWEDARKSCDVRKLPATTDAVIFKVCGENATNDKCVCNVAKAHSCHVGCRELKPACPAECGDKHCKWGPAANGGVPLSGGHTGVCHKFCSKNVGGSRRLCGVGPDYQSGLFVDCSNCNPMNAQAANSRAGRKEQWITCMANCFPTPTCTKMCAEGTPECYAKCVEKYRGVVDPYWDVFKGSLRTVPIIVPKSHAQMAKNYTIATTNYSYNGTNHTIEATEEVVMEEIIEEGSDGELVNESAEEPPPVDFEKVVKDNPVKEEEHVKEEKQVKKIPVQEEAGEKEFDDASYDGDEFEDDGEWEDPYAGENEWDEVEDSEVEKMPEKKVEKMPEKEVEKMPEKEVKKDDGYHENDEFDDNGEWEDPYAGENEWEDDSYDDDEFDDNGEWEDPYAGENEWDDDEWDDDEWDDDEFDDDGEWEDPWAGENEWDDDDYYSDDDDDYYSDWHLVGVRRLSGNGTSRVGRTKVHHKLARRAKVNHTLARRATGKHSRLRRRSGSGTFQARETKVNQTFAKRSRFKHNTARRTTGNHSLVRRRRRLRRVRGSKANESLARRAGGHHVLKRRWRRLQSAEGDQILARNTESFTKRAIGNHSLIRRRGRKARSSHESRARGAAGNHVLLRKWRRLRIIRSKQSLAKRRLRRKLLRRLHGRHSRAADTLRKAADLGLT